MICLTVCKAVSASCRVRQMMTKSSAYRIEFPQRRVPLCPVHIQHMQVDVCQQGADDTALRGTYLGGVSHAIFQNPRFEPLTDEFQYPPVANPPFEQRHQHCRGQWYRSNSEYRRQPPTNPLSEPSSPQITACCALRFGRKPYELSRKLASKMGSITNLQACCTTRSRTVGIPNGLCLPSAFGM